MAKPKIADTKPKEVTLKAGEHHWCACGRSSSQPFCDGSHRGTGIEPLAFTIDKAEQAYLCMCKRTKNPSYCDGTHSRLDADAEDEPDEQSADGMPTARNTTEEPTVELIHALARDGLAKTGQHGQLAAMGVPRKQLPQ